MTFGPYINALPGDRGIVPGVLQVGFAQGFVSTDLSGGPLTLWSRKALYPWDWTPAQLSVVSTSASDTLAGTGARRVIVYGLDSNLEEIQETLDLNGTTPVVTLNTYHRINEVTCLCGSGGTNAGSISLSSGAAVVGYVHAGHGHSMSSVYTVPANWAQGAALHRYWLNKSSKNAGTAVSRLYIRIAGTGTWQLVGGFASKDVVADYIAQSLIQLPPGTDIHGVLQDLDTATATTIVGSFELTRIPVYGA